MDNVLSKKLPASPSQGGQATSYKLKSGFGLLEVVISIGILAMVMGAAVYAGRISLRNNIIANQRSQAYNLVRENLEIVRQMRDSTWIDQTVNDWNTPFQNANFDGQPHYLTFSNPAWELHVGDAEPKNLDGTKFHEKIYFSKIDPTSTLNNQMKILANSDNFNTADNQVIMVVKTVVSWQSYGNAYSVTGAVNLTDWKPQI